MGRIVCWVESFLFAQTLVQRVSHVITSRQEATSPAFGLCYLNLISSSTHYRYDPKVLERVQNDEGFAAAAAKASAGRPTYCDNRYYRAVANGGQGKSWMLLSYGT